MINDKELYLMLDSNNSKEEQEKGIQIGLKRKNLEIFMQPYGKSVWENCAKILYQKSDEELKKYIPQLLEWLQDLTWPGALIILERMKRFDPDILKPDYEKTIKNAYLVHDINWIDFLSYILENSYLKDKISLSCLSIIAQAHKELEEY